MTSLPSAPTPLHQNCKTFIYLLIICMHLIQQIPIDFLQLLSYGVSPYSSHLSNIPSRALLPLIGLTDDGIAQSPPDFFATLYIHIVGHLIPHPMALITIITPDYQVYILENSNLFSINFSINSRPIGWH